LATLLPGHGDTAPWLQQCSSAAARWITDTLRELRGEAAKKIAPRFFTRLDQKCHSERSEESLILPNGR
jgi:hypothetical protein